MPISTYLSYMEVVSFSGERNWSTMDNH